jgi:hypothetical protein
MRRAALAVLLAVTACGMPGGVERDRCLNDEIRDAEVVVTRPDGVDERPIPIDCMHDIGLRRIRVGFTLPPGPSCHQLSRVEMVETAEAIRITLFAAVNDDPAAGACPDEPVRAITDMDVAAPIGRRILLDGSTTAGFSDLASP